MTCDNPSARLAHGAFGAASAIAACEQSVKCARIWLALSLAPQRRPQGIRGPMDGHAWASGSASSVHIVRGLQSNRRGELYRRRHRGRDLTPLVWRPDTSCGDHFGRRGQLQRLGRLCVEGESFIAHQILIVLSKEAAGGNYHQGVRNTTDDLHEFRRVETHQNARCLNGLCNSGGRRCSCCSCRHGSPPQTIVSLGRSGRSVKCAPILLAAFVGPKGVPAWLSGPPSPATCSDAAGRFGHMVSARAFCPRALSDIGRVLETVSGKTHTGPGATMAQLKCRAVGCGSRYRRQSLGQDLVPPLFHDRSTRPARFLFLGTSTIAGKAGKSFSPVNWLMALVSRTRIGFRETVEDIPYARW